MKRIFILVLFILIIHSMFSNQLDTELWVNEYYSNRMSKYDNNLLIATSKGIIKYDDTNKEIYNISEDLGTSADEKIMMISVAPNNDILYTIAPREDYSYSDGKEGTYIYNGEEVKPYEAYFFGNLSYSLSCSYDKSNSLWISAFGWIFPANIENVEYPFCYQAPDVISSAVICSITDTQFDSKDNLWLAIYGDYNHLLCLKNGDPKVSKILVGGEKKICSLAVDKNDNVWFATEEGIHCYNQETGKDSIMTNATNPNIPATQFYANDIDDSGNIWFTSSTTLMKYNGTDFTTYTCDGYEEARSILCDEDIVWVLLKNDKLLKFQNNEFETIDLSPVVNNEEYATIPRGIDLGEYAFGIPAEQLNFTNKSPFTLSFWVNIKDLNHDKGSTQFLNIRNPRDGYPLCDWGYLFSTLQEYGRDDFGEVWENNELLICVREDIASFSTPFVRERNFQFIPNDWIYVTFISYYTNAPQMILYINGEATLKFKSAFTSPHNLMNWSQDYIIMIGGSAKNRSPLNAYIDKVQFYNKALSETEVKESMAAPLLNDESLLGYWDFEDGCTTNAEGFMTADNGTIKATMYKILQDSTELSIGTEIQPFTYGKGVNTELVLQGVEESTTEESNTKAYVSNGVLYIESADGINSVEVYDAMGRVITSGTYNGSSVQTQLPSTLKGVIMVKVNNEVVKVAI